MAAGMPVDPVSLAVAEGVATLSMERPPVNAMGRAFMAALGTALDRVAADPAVRAVVVASGLPGTFSAGADIRELEGLDPERCAAFLALGHEVFGRIGRMPQPVLAAIHGVCFGGGLELALACDFRVAAESARLGHPEVNLGVLSGWGGTQRLPRLIGRAHAAELLMLGESISAATALAWGLVHRVVPDAGLLSDTTALARKLAAKSPAALAKIKEALERGQGLPLAEALREETRCYVDAYRGAGGREGIRAFLEKRAPRF